jgi:hypothetical protein
LFDVVVAALVSDVFAEDLAPALPVVVLSVVLCILVLAADVFGVELAAVLPWVVLSFVL